MLKELDQTGQTVVLTTHYMEEADQLCNRVAIMDHGKILALDTPASLKKSIGADTIITVKVTKDGERLAQALAKEIQGVVATRVVENVVSVHVQGGDRLVPRVVNVAESAGVEILDLAVAEPSLETVFINLTGKELREV
jgi:ABC-2 type transport system ATP-binding protein